MEKLLKPCVKKKAGLSSRATNWISDNNKLVLNWLPAESEEQTADHIEQFVLT